MILTFVCAFVKNYLYKYIQNSCTNLYNYKKGRKVRFEESLWNSKGNGVSHFLFCQIVRPVVLS